jgi:hypothetical protein
MQNYSRQLAWRCDLLRNLVLLSGLLAMWCGTSAHATVIVSDPTVSGVPGDFVWEYEISLDADQQIQFEDFFTFYDIQGLFSAALSTSDWILTPAFDGITPSGAVVTDDPGLPNITVTYMGADPIVGPGVLLTLEIGSIYGDGAPGTFAAAAHNLAGEAVFNVASPLMPTQVPTPIPEPSVIGLVGVGLGLLLARKRRSASPRKA